MRSLGCDQLYYPHPGLLLSRWFSGDRRDISSQISSRYPSQINSNNTDVVVGGTPRRYDGRAGWLCFILTSLYLSCCCRVSMTATEWAHSARSPSNIRRLSRKGDALQASPLIWFQIAEVFFHSRVTGACPVTTDLIRRVNVRMTRTTFDTVRS